MHKESARTAESPATLRVSVRCYRLSPAGGSLYCPSNPLYPDFEPRLVRGRIRLPDVEIKKINGLEHVVAKLGQGTSLFDEPDVFGPTNWAYSSRRKRCAIPKIFRR